MSKVIRNGQAIADVINDDKALANEVALNLSDEILRIVFEKRSGKKLPKMENKAYGKFDFQTAVDSLLEKYLEDTLT